MITVRVVAWTIRILYFANKLRIKEAKYITQNDTEKEKWIFEFVTLSIKSQQAGKS